jgi:16S rRNA (uracil1498-N3)-methyltransferase
MAHLHRFYVSPDDHGDAECALPRDEAHHALRVARLRVGDRVALFDGRGWEGQGPIVHAGKKEVTVSVEESRTEAQPDTPVVLAQAWLHRGAPLEFIIRHGTELGVTAFCFFRAVHSEKAPKINSKWERLAIEVCKQCGRLWLPEFHIAKDLSAVLEESSGTVLLASMDETPQPLAAVLEGAKSVTLLVGPEGDFAEWENALALREGARPISLGTTTFRSEMAAVVALSLIQYQQGTLGPLA